MQTLYSIIQYNIATYILDIAGFLINLYYPKISKSVKWSISYYFNILYPLAENNSTTFSPARTYSGISIRD